MGKITITFPEGISIQWNVDAAIKLARAFFLKDEKMVNDFWGMATIWKTKTFIHFSSFITSSFVFQLTQNTAIAYGKANLYERKRLQIS